MKYVTGKVKLKEIDKINFGGEMLTERNLICEDFNTYFCEVGEEVDNSIPRSQVDPLSYMPNPQVESLFLFPVSI